MKKASELKSGDIIPVKGKDKKWLPGPLTIIDITEGEPDKGGSWLKIRASFISPNVEKPSTIHNDVWKYRPDTLVEVISQERMA